MSTTLTTPAREGGGAMPQRIVNDFSIQVATANGSGSQTSNIVLMRAIFQMGIPVSGKNMFPSNIQGLPTWFTIRANKHGWIGRKKEVDFLVAMNPETARQDCLELEPGRVLVYDEPLKLNELRSDLIMVPVPFDKLVGPACPEPKLRKLVKNMIYDGVLAFLLDIDMEEIRKALFKQFGPKKVKAAELNWGAAQAGYNWAKENLKVEQPYHLERMNENKDKFIIDGNAATALGCIYAGCTFVAWYPITPSSTLVEQMMVYLKRLRTGPDGKGTYAVVQAEDELASIGMVIGASWAGARAMTATSGPGVSLMSEFVGLAYYTDIPAVIVDVQRVGPSTGLPTRTMQGDILANAVLSHGDTRHPILFPSGPEECFSMAGEAFDLAEQFQTPIFVNTDLDLGMNVWASDPFPVSDQPINRGKVLSADDLERLGGFERYRDVDGDGVGYRTLPGTNHPAASYFTRGSGHNEKAQYSERPEDYVNNVDRLSRKFESIRKAAPAPEIQYVDGARIGIVYCGTSREAGRESQDQLQREYNMPASTFRVRAYPYPEALDEFIDRHERVYIVDQNRDGQLYQLMQLDLPPARVAKLRSLRYYNGLPIDARSITDDIRAKEAE